MPNFKPLPPLERLNELLKVVEIPEDKFGVWSGLVWKVKRNGTKGVGSVAGYPHQHSINSERKDWVVRVDGVYYYASRVIYCMTTGEDPGDVQVDHEDQNWLNNNAWNLRLDVDGDFQQVNKSMQRNNTSGVVGVYRPKGSTKWKTEVKGKYLGYFVCKKEAARVVNEKWIEMEWKKKGRKLNDLESVECSCECCVRGSREASDT